MPITKVKDLGVAQSTTSVASISLQIPAGGVAAGNRIVLALATNKTDLPTAIADSKGNSYTVDSPNATNSTNYQCFIIGGQCDAALAANDTITVTFASTRAVALAATEWTGIAPTDAVMQTASGAGSSASPATSSITTTQAPALLIAAFATGGGAATFTPGSGYSELAEASSSGTIRTIQWEYRHVTATGNYVGDATFGGSKTWAGALVAYRAQPSGPIEGEAALAALATVNGTGAIAAASEAQLSATAQLTADGQAGRLPVDGATSLAGWVDVSATGMVRVGGAAHVSAQAGVTAQAAVERPLVLPPLVSLEQPLTLHIFDRPNGLALCSDLSPFIVDGEFSTNEHGYESLIVSLDLPPDDPWWWYERLGIEHVVLAHGACVVWEGRLEDVAPGDGLLRMTAMGYWSALGDVPYTSLWSDTRFSAWDALTGAEDRYAFPDRYDLDTNNRLYMAPRSGTVHGKSPIISAYYGYSAPHAAGRWVEAVSFNYEIMGATEGTTWQLGVQRRTDTWGFLDNVWTMNTAATVLSGVETLTFPPAQCITVYLFRNAANGVYAGEDGAVYAKITNLRLKTTTAPRVTADLIAKDIADTVRGYNGDQLMPGTALLQNPGRDVPDALYLDQYGTAILPALAQLGDSTGQPWRASVAPGRYLELAPRMWNRRTWYIDRARQGEAQRSLSRMRNGVYTVYEDAAGRVRRTAPLIDYASRTRYDLVRLQAHAATTHSEAAANADRLAVLAAGKDPEQRGEVVTVDAIYDEAGTAWPIWAAHTGDQFMDRNTSPHIAAVGAVPITHTRVDLRAGTLEITPASADDAQNTL